MEKYVLNAILAKKTGYGGFNVACNFYRAAINDSSVDWYYLLSQDMADFLHDEIPSELLDYKVFVFPNQPNRKTYFGVKRDIKKILKEIKPDVVYSILAPSYFTFDYPEVMRCANAWTVVGGVNKYALKVTPAKLRYSRLIKAKFIQWQMRKTKYFITQSQIAKQCILRTVNTEPENVYVVSNVLPSIYQRISVRAVPHKGYNMVYASSPAYHKDFMILPQVASILKKQGMDDFKIHYTIPQGGAVLPAFMEQLRAYDVENYFINHGFVNRQELAVLFSQCDLGLFPSLLETFSATLLEYMYFQLPIVASDLDFNREVAEKAAEYFIPHDAEDMARKIYQVYSDENLRDSLLEQAKTQLAKYSNNTDKYGETVDFLRKVAKMDSKKNE